MADEQTPADNPTIPAETPTGKKNFGNLTAGIIFDSQEDLDNYKREQEEKLTLSDSPTIPRKVPTGKASSTKAAPTKKKNSPTLKQGAGLNKIKQDDLVKWTVFVQGETKTAIGKAAHKAGLTITDWLDSRLREVATSELTHKPKPPAKPADVADLMKQLETRLANQQAENVQKLADQMQQAIDSRPSNLKEWLFGKSKQG